MDLILWRHAEAKDGPVDMLRELSDRGWRQASLAARWLNRHLPANTRMIVSPALRAQQTAQAMGRAFDTVESIAPGALPEAVLAAAAWPDHEGAVLVVGHQPTLGMVAALLMTGQPAAWSVRKSGIWWLSHRLRHGAPQIVLRSVIHPEQL
jgi:phosphohistidine phosphatase